jgi:uncharacterized membrane protein YeaQ/YmgE (transglycosylase-associated protein family)
MGGLVGAMDFFTSPDGIICLVAGAVLGALAAFLIKGRVPGLVWSVVLGAVGGVLGGYFFDWADFMQINDFLDPVIAAVVGAAVLLGIASLFSRREATPQV